MRKLYAPAFNKFRFLFFALSLLLGLMPSSDIYSQTVVVVYPPTSGNFLVPAGVSSIKVEVWGGGGGGGGAYFGYGGGGGGGAYNVATFPVSAGQTYTIIIGGGGAGGNGGNGGVGVNGIITTVTGTGGTVSANGGTGGNYGVFGGTTGGAGGTGGTFIGGNGGTSTSNGAGGGGGAGNGAVGGAGSNSAPGNGGSGAYPGGIGGAQMAAAGTGNAGVAPGGGGGGAKSNGFTNSTGGAGGNGKVVLTYTVILSPPTIASFTPPNGCGTSTSVVITGANFTGATAVTFGGTNAASFTVNSSTQITATPAAGATGAISVTTPAGTSTSTGTFTFNPTAPSALTYTLTTATYCVGTAIASNSPSNSGGAPTSYSVSPTLPAGLGIDPATGIITGTPTAITTSANYTVTASNSCGNTTKQLTIGVTAAPITFTYSSNPATYCAGAVITANSPTTTSGGAPTSYSVSPSLPAGLSLSATTGVITGTPTTTGTGTYTVTGTNTCGSATTGVVITINPAAPSALNYTTTSVSYCVGTLITNNNPSNSGGAPTSYSVSPALPAGLGIDPATGIISGTPTAITASAIYTVTASNSCGNSTKGITIVVTSPPVAFTYSSNPATYCAGAIITANSPTTTSGGAPTSYSVSPGLPAGLSLSATTGIISGTPTTTAGVAMATYTVTGTNSCGSTTVGVVITISPAAPTALIYTTTTATYCVGTAIANNNPSNSGGAPTAYSVSPALPAGLSIDPGTGIISGTPTAVTASASYTVTATNSCGSTTKALTIAVTSPPVTITYSTNPATYCAGLAITNNSPTTTSGGVPTSYSVSPALPAGLSLSTTTGIISGTPTTTAGVAMATYTVTGTNSCGSTTVGVVITISPAAPTALIYTTTTATYCVGTAIANNNPSNSGGAPTAYSVSPALPAGLSIDPGTGIISGTPTAVTASASYTVTATNSCGSTTKALTIAVSTTPSITYGTNPAVYCAGVVIASNTPTNTGGTVTSYSVSPTLPAGLSLSITTGVISGTPTTTTGVAMATYTVTANSSCGAATTGVVITISPAAPTALTYTTTSVSYCVGTAIANNNPSNSGGAPTAYSVSPALPAGLSIDPGTGIISGTPTAVTASASYTVTATNSCGSTTKALTIAVSTTPSITYGTNPAVYCAGVVIASNISTNTGGAVTSYSVSPALPAGLSLSTTTGVISGTPTTTAGVAMATYAVTANSSCGATTTGVVITISPAAPTALTYTTTTVSYCNGVTISNNNPSNTGGLPTSYSVSPALPTGLSLNSITGVISGTPTVPSAAANYVVTASNSCGSTPKTLSITVNDNATITLTSAAGTDNQTKCISNAITNITYAIGGLGYTGATLSGTLPSGVTGTYSGGIFTIKGTPTASGTFGYTVTTTGPCTNTSLSGTITVQANSVLTRTSSSGTTAQTVCINSNIANITYSVTGGGTGASITAGALPTGVSGNFSGGVFTISGTPTTSGAYSYTVTTSGPCTNQSLSGTITVNDNATISLSSVAGTDNQTICISTAITNITYAIGGYGTTGASVAGLPAGVTGSYSGGVYTIKGNPSVSGTFNYTVSTTGPCGKPTASGTITVTANATISLSSATGTDGQSLCANTTLTNITYAIGGTGTGASITAGALPAGVTGTFSGGVFTISGTPTVSGTFNYTVTSAGPCATPSASGTITVIAAPTGNFFATENSGTTPNDNIICAGDNVTFHAPSGYNAYTFYVGTTQVLAGHDSLYNTNSLVSGQQVTVAVVNSLNCGTTFGPITITVNTPPTPTLSADKLTICAGDTVTFTAGGGGSGANYTFELNGSPVQSGASNIYKNHSLSSTDKVTVMLTDANNCSATYATPISITVNPLPIPTLISNPTPATICLGDNITFTAGGGSTYNFMVNGTSAPGQTGGNTFSSTALTNPSIVSVQDTSALGCVATSSGIVVTVNPPPTGSLTISSSIICYGMPVKFTFSVSTYKNYQFFVNGVSEQNGTSNTYNNSTLNPGDNVTVQVSTGNSCNATFTAPTVTVNPIPKGTLTVSPSNTICAGDNVTLTATSDPSFTGYRFLNGANTLQNGPNNIYQTTSLADGNVITVQVTNNSGCISNFDTITMHVNPIPTGTLGITENSGNTPNDGIICAGAPVTFTAPTGMGYTYNFLINGGPAPGQDGTNVYTTDSLHDQDKVTVTVTNGSGCVGLLNSYTITVNPLPTVAPITGTMSECVNSTTTLSEATIGGTWSSADVTIATVGASTGLVTGVAPGIVNIIYTVTNSNGCSQIATTTDTVNALPVVAAIGGLSDVCVGSAIALTDGTSGGTWSTSNDLLATVDGSGNVTGVADGPVTISYSVTNGNGCMTIVNKTINVHALPVVAAITYNSPATSFSVCVNSTISLSDAGGGVWSSGNTAIATINATTGVVTGVTAGTATISYAVTDANGCSTTITQDVVVNALPVPTLTGPNPICPSTTDIYTTEQGNSDYVWNVTGGVIDSGGTSTDYGIKITWNSAGPYSVYINYTNASGCSGATSVTVTSNSGTVPTLTGTTPICVNSDGSYSTQSGQSNYTWTAVGGTVTPGGNTASVNWTIAGIDTVGINFTDVNGCVAAAPTLFAVTVNPLPTVVTHDITVCSPETVDLTATAITSGSTAGLTYTYWTDAGATIPYTTPTTAGAGTYYIKGTTSSGCIDIKPVTVTVNPLPTVFNTNGGGSYCNGGSGVAVGLSGSQPGINYQLYDGANPVGSSVSGNGSAISFGNQTSAGNYTVVAANATTGCTINMNGSETVTVNPLPTVFSITGGGSYCIGGTGVAVGLSGSQSGVNYQLYNGANPVGSSVSGTGNPISFGNQTAAGSYTVVAANGTTGCISDMNGSETVAINPLPTIFNVTGGGSYCNGGTGVAIGLSGSQSGVNYQLYNGAIPAGSSVSGTGSAISFGNQTDAGTYTVVAANAVTGCTNNMGASATVTINPLPTLVITNPAAVCFPSTVDLTAPAVTAGSTSGLTFTYYTDAGGTTTLASPSAVTTSGTYYIKGTIAATGCSDIIKPVIVTINPLPTITGTTSVCVGSTTQLTGSGSPAATNPWISGATGIATITSTGLVTGLSAGNSTITYTNSTGCSNTATITVNPDPSSFIVTPASATICQGTVQPLLAGNNPTTGSVVQSNNNNYTIPDNSSNGVISTIPVTGVPVGAIINSMTVNFNITEGYDQDLRINLKAPNGSILNLVNQKGGTGDNFTNTTVSSLGGTAFSTISTAAPFTGTYAADAVIGVAGATTGGGNTSNTNSFSSLYSTNPNGTWTFSARDANSEGSNGAILNWTITINYTVSGSPLSVTWSPATNLYTDAGATVPYTGQSLSTVYAEPDSSGTFVYTATETNASGCSNAAQTTLTVTPTPIVSLSAEYCGVPGKVVLTASSVPAATSYSWSTGGTDDTIQVNVANNYSVTVTAGGCPGTGNITVAQNLVVNGDFSAGYTGFTTGYTKANMPWNGSCTYPQTPFPGTGLLDEGVYAVSTNGQLTHCNFWGSDHTTGNGNFLLVNGSGVSYQVWQDTVNVLPNTTYYFSAWGMSLNNVGPFASLQFNINGAQVGTVDILASGVDANNNGTVASGAPWSQFYGNWTSGPTTTTAVISITDLQTALDGNDFGIDDINFGTLSPFIFLVSAPGTDGQTPCVNTPITPIVYSVGSTSFGPTISSPLPAGLTGTFTPGSGLYTITGTPTVAGNYTYTLTTTGSCNPTSATGTINIQSQKITLSSGNPNPVQCKTAAVNIGFTLGGTSTGATATGLPAGLIGSTSGNTYTISGTPNDTDTARVYQYSIMTTGTCNPDTVTGTITLQQQTITHNSGDSIQTLCINAPDGIKTIQYTIGGPGTLSGTVTGLPNGVTAAPAVSGIILISGVPTEAGTFTYYVTGSGACTNALDSGVITVTPAATLTLTSGAGTDGQTICINSPITPDITYSINNATNATVDGLPDGVTGSVTSGVLTITGTPTEAGIFTYTITTTDGCGTGTATGTITVQSQTIDLTTGNASPSVCENATMPSIVYTFGGNATGVTVSGLPNGVGGAPGSGNTFIISGIPTEFGTFEYIVTTTTTGSCAPVADTGIITVQQAPVGGNVKLVTTSVCAGGQAILTLFGQAGTIVSWESSADGGTTWIPNGNVQISDTVKNASVASLWRVEVSNGCGTANSSTATVGIHNLWTGGNGTTDWNTASNWSDDSIPSTSCPTVLVPSILPLTNYPILSTGPMATIINLQIASGASVTVTGNTIQIAGTITNGGIFDLTGGSIEFNGTSPQSVGGSTFSTNTVQNLIISNGSGVSVDNTLGDTLKISGTLSFGSASGQINTGNNVTLLSNSSGTANVGVMSSTNTISGNVTVDRYINTGAVGNEHGKSWQLLAVPTFGPQTIRGSWMEGATESNVVDMGAVGPANLNPGYGTMTTSNVTNAGTFPSPGFDVYTSPGPSIEVYDSATNGYVGPPTTDIPIYNKKGYLVLVRGDRSVFTYNAPATPTILRTTGTLFTPATPPPSSDVLLNEFQSVGNPYASAIDLRNLTLTPSVQNFFYVWDPKLAGAYGLGAFQTLSQSGANYTATPGGGSYPGISNTIQSGQGFFIAAFGTGNGSISFNENDKVNGSTLVLRGGSVTGATGNIAQLRANLYGINDTAYIADGNLLQYNENYSDKIDGMDARKIINMSENFGILSGGKDLVIERRTDIQKNDTIFYNLTGLREQKYKIMFNASGLSAYGLQGYIEDTYLNTRTALNMEGTTEADFTVTNTAGSYAANRFNIVFAAQPPTEVSLTFISLTAQQQDANIAVNWKVQNEKGMQQYEVETSMDGVNFTKAATVMALNSGIGSYQWIDVNVSAGDHYYRIRCVADNGNVSYSTVVKVTVVYGNPSISIHPNPITDGILHLQFVNQAAGRYGIRLINSLGQLIAARQIELAGGGNATEDIQWNYYLAHGVYQLEITRPDGTVKVIKVLY